MNIGWSIGRVFDEVWNIDRVLVEKQHITSSYTIKARYLRASAYAFLLVLWECEDGDGNIRCKCGTRGVRQGGKEWEKGGMA